MEPAVRPVDDFDVIAAVGIYEMKKRTLPPMTFMGSPTAASAFVSSFSGLELSLQETADVHRIKQMAAVADRMENFIMFSFTGQLLKDFKYLPNRI